MYTITSNNDNKYATLYHNGVPLVADNNHPSFNAIVELLLAGDEESAAKLYDVSDAANEKFEEITTRVSIKNGRIYYDHEEVDSSLSEQIIRFMQNDEDFYPLVNFYERIQRNPDPYSREQIYRWLRTHRFTITEDGTILGYKGVNSDLTSIHSGTAIVDGETLKGNIPNKLDSVVTMPRSEIDSNPDVACSWGLHVGTYDYANSFGSKTLLVEVDPQDIVSVPSDANDEKMRVCRYLVHDVVESPLDIPLYSIRLNEDPEAEPDPCCDDSCECDECKYPEDWIERAEEAEVREMEENTPDPKAPDPNTRWNLDTSSISITLGIMKQND